MGTIGARTAAALPKIFPVKLPFRARLVIAFGDVDFAHEADVRFRSGRVDSPVDLAILIKGLAHRVHAGGNPLHRADPGGGGFLDGILAARRHPKRGMRLLDERYG